MVVYNPRILCRQIVTVCPSPGTIATNPRARNESWPKSERNLCETRLLGRSGFKTAEIKREMSDQIIHLFDDFALDLGRGFLRRGDELVHLRAQTFEVLRIPGRTPGATGQQR
jgi:hypothetical protein